MKILSVEQTRAADQYTIDHEPISSIDLMERAALALFDWCNSNLDKGRRIFLFCGRGNNGGDGLALARLLFGAGYEVAIYYLDENGSPDFQLNWQRLPNDLTRNQIDLEHPVLPDFEGCVIIDALFGSGLNRPLDGAYCDLVKALNENEALRIAIDFPSGLMGDEIVELSSSQVFNADYTLTFQYPKLALVHPFSSKYAGQVEVLDIGIHQAYLDQAKSNLYWQTSDELKRLLKPRAKHSYKGIYGHAWILAGSKNTMGAALIAAEASLRCGLGLLSLNVPISGFSSFNSRLPEAMLLERASGIPDSWSRYSAVLIGPGLGLNQESENLVNQVLESFTGPLLIDADGINLLVRNLELLKSTRAEVVLTPHPGEFRRLIGVESLGLDQLELAQEFTQKYQCRILLKGTISVLIEPDGSMTFYDFGSSALAKGGSGDLLAGSITAFLAQGYSATNAVSLGVFMQGRASLHATEALGDSNAVLSSDILKNLGKAFQDLT